MTPRPERLADVFAGSGVMCAQEGVMAEAVGELADRLVLEGLAEEAVSEILDGLRAKGLWCDHTRGGCLGVCKDCGKPCCEFTDGCLCVFLAPIRLLVRIVRRAVFHNRTDFQFVRRVD